MKSILEILEEVLEETLLIKSALKEKDFEVANVSIQRRSPLIMNLSKLKIDKSDEKAIEVYNQFVKEEAICETLLEQLTEETRDELYQIKVKRNTVVQSKRKFNSYAMASLRNHTGNLIDQKK